MATLSPTAKRGLALLTPSSAEELVREVCRVVGGDDVAAADDLVVRRGTDEIGVVAGLAASGDEAGGSGGAGEGEGGTVSSSSRRFWFGRFRFA